MRALTGTRSRSVSRNGSTSTYTCLAGTTAAFTRTARYILDIATWRHDPDHRGYHSATLHPADGHFTPNSQGIYIIRWR
jgi:hypothetical protein